MSDRVKTDYPGVYYREFRRLGNSGTEKDYYVICKKEGKAIEEKVGRQYVDDMTPARASRIRGERIEGKRQSRKEIKAALVAKDQERKNRMTIKKLWEKYKELNPQLKGITQDQNRFDNYIKPIFGDKEPQDLTPIEIDALRIKLLQTKEPATVRNILELLRRLLNYGKNKQLSSGINFTIEMPRVDNIVTEDLTPDQLEKLMDVIEKNSDLPAAQMMHLTLHTGMRRGEMFRLKWVDINYNRGFIHLVDPKGGKGQDIPISSQAKKILKSITKTQSAYVFPGRGGNQRTDIKKQLKRLKKLADLPADFRPLQGLRQVYASMKASSGEVDQYTLQKLLTHKSPKMTQRYAHLRDEALKKAAEVVDPVLKRKSQ